MNKKIISVFIAGFIGFSLFGAELKAKVVTTEAAKQENIDESIDYLKNQVSVMTVPAEKRAVYIFLASLQEQMAYYADAQKSYATAASIAAGDAENMPKKSNEQLVLDAVRCALSSGDSDTADRYLNSAVRNSKNDTIQAYIKLYSQWSTLCRAEKVEDLQEPVLMLQAYTKLDNMKSVQPAVYLTLWYITGEKSYAKEIKTKFPKSIECAIVNGDVQLLPTPFWFFVPKSGEAEQGTGSYTPETQTVETKVVANKSENKSASDKISKYQLGLFKTENNAKLLAEEVKGKGFQAYVTSEVRPSGTTYYIVLVNEDAKGNVAERLRSNGYDCYAVE